MSGRMTKFFMHGDFLRFLAAKISMNPYTLARSRSPIAVNSTADKLWAVPLLASLPSFASVGTYEAFPSWAGSFY